MKRNKPNLKPADYHQLFTQGYNYKQVAGKLGVHASSAFRQYTKWQALQKEAVAPYLPDTNLNDITQQSYKGYQQAWLEQDVIDYEALRIKSLCNLYNKLNQAVLLGNTKEVKAYTLAIAKINEPLSTFANIKGIKS
ncbi:hypothetical protein [Entomospira culicis]|uniref:Uncharacterized protein n=1 Tax=Entomospira culicis TaxID=2719989 RepID=A0A968GHV7_9SPIO|nr:hypothetical protein [Entomospira culicis]NIZ19103.1 hypothetical protein [Entomospira culicis]NIZ69317.1 hypothetical protein [Entomospira culicis]WDI37903.1 hypothetical protein PVA46_03700 [Entomospira culicis]WDI39530.1 hypothetical protein PVA47_03700 [Entomospira culicis]